MLARFSQSLSASQCMAHQGTILLFEGICTTIRQQQHGLSVEAGHPLSHSYLVKIFAPVQPSARRVSRLRLEQGIPNDRGQEGRVFIEICQHPTLPQSHTALYRVQTWSSCSAAIARHSFGLETYGPLGLAWFWRGRCAIASGASQGNVYLLCLRIVQACAFIEFCKSRPEISWAPYLMCTLH